MSAKSLLRVLLCIIIVLIAAVVDIQACITTAMKLFQTTPISTYMRYYQQGPAHSENIPSEAVRNTELIFIRRKNRDNCMFVCLYVHKLLPEF